MPRKLGGTNTLVLHDAISDSKIRLDYRMPTTKELIAYRDSLVTRRGAQIVSRVGESRLQYGQLILTGIRPGDFLVQKAGKWEPLASDPQHPGYNPDWKQIVAEQAPDLIETLATHVFDASLQAVPEVDASQGGTIEDAEKN